MDRGGEKLWMEGRIRRRTDRKMEGRMAGKMEGRKKE